MIKLWTKGLIQVIVAKDGSTSYRLTGCPQFFTGQKLAFTHNFMYRKKCSHSLSQPSKYTKSESTRVM